MVNNSIIVFRVPYSASGMCFIVSMKMMIGKKFLFVGNGSTKRLSTGIWLVWSELITLFREQTKVISIFVMQAHP